MAVTYIDINTDLRKKWKKVFDKDFFLSWWIKQFLWKKIENCEKTNIKLVKIEKRRNYLALELNYYTTKFFKEKLLVIEMRKTELLIKKLVSLGLSVSELGKISMYEVWYNYVTP